MRNLIILAAFAIAAACTPAPPTPPEAPTPAQTSSPAPSADEASCAATGGSWQPVCRMQKPTCVITYADAGKACTSGDQCAGDCVSSGDSIPAGEAASGICSTNSDPCGCRTKIEDGKSVGTLCVD
jgi:hypothetical protein